MPTFGTKYFSIWPKHKFSFVTVVIIIKFNMTLVSLSLQKVDNLCGSLSVWLCPLQTHWVGLNIFSAESYLIFLLYRYAWYLNMVPSKPSSCACKGIRTCLICEQVSSSNNQNGGVQLEKKVRLTLFLVNVVMKMISCYWYYGDCKKYDFCFMSVCTSVWDTS